MIAAPARELGAAAVELAEAMVGRTLRKAEQAIDVLRLDQALNGAKDELEAAIFAEMIAATASWVAGVATSPALRVTPDMLLPLDRLVQIGRDEGLLELERLGYEGVQGPARLFAHATPAPEGRDLEGYLRTNLARIERHIEDELVTADLGAASQSAIAQALLAVPGGRDIASRVISTALIDGLGMTFEANEHLIRCWEYTAVLDAGTCPRCAPLDGKRYDSLQALFVDLPNFGPNPHCRGGGRCRCRAVPCKVSDVGQNAPDATPAADLARAGELLNPRITGELKKEIDLGIAAIEKVHDLPADMGKLDVLRYSGNREGGYRYRAPRAGIRARNEAVDIQVNGKAVDPAGTLTHEVGHWIDDQGIGKTLGTPGGASEAPNLADLAELKRAIEDTAAYDRLLELRDSPTAKVKVTVRVRDNEGVHETELERAPDRQHVRYLLTPEELFARAYSQWIATRSESKALIGRIASDVGKDLSLSVVDRRLRAGRPRIRQAFREAGMVKELIAEGLTEEQVVEVYVDNGFTELQAREIVAAELDRPDDYVDRVEVPDA